MFATTTANSPLSTLPADCVIEIYSHLNFQTRFSFGLLTKFTNTTFNVINESIVFLQKANISPRSSKMSDIMNALNYYQNFGPKLLESKSDNCGYSSRTSLRNPIPTPRVDPGYYYSWKGDAGPMLAEHKLAVKQLGIQ